MNEEQKNLELPNSDPLTSKHLTNQESDSDNKECQNENLSINSIDLSVENQAD